MLDRAAEDLAYLRELYERFRADVNSGNPIDDYDKDELLDIYDYAQDEGDVMVQFFVFLTASRLFPEDHSFDDRAGFFLSYLSTDAAADMMRRAQREDTPLWAVLQIGIKNYPDGDPEKDVDALLNRYQSLDTEAVIKLIDLLRDMDRLDILARRTERLRAVAEDASSLIYEMAAGLADSPKHLALARTLIEELTKSEPFNGQDWVLLARIELNDNRPTEALAALDYAAAIDPHNDEARALRGIILSTDTDAEKQKEGRKLLREHLKTKRDDREAIVALADSLENKGDVAGAMRTLHAYLKLFPADIEILYKILRLDPTSPAPYIATFAEGGSHNEDDWIALAERLCVKDEMPNQACVLLSAYNSQFGLSRGLEMFLNLLYTVGMYQEHIDYMQELLNQPRTPQEGETEGEHPDDDPTVGTPHGLSFTAFTLLAASLLMNKNYDDAAELTEHLLTMELPSVGCDLRRLLAQQGCIRLLRDIREYALHPDTIPTDEDFEPVYELLIHPNSPAPKRKK